MYIIVTPERWLALAASEGAFNTTVCGFTLRARMHDSRVLDRHLMYFCMHNGLDVVVGDNVFRLAQGTFF